MAKVPKVKDVKKTITNLTQIEFRAPQNKGEFRRILLWITWTVNMSVSELKDSIDNQSWRAPVAACVLGGIMVLLFNIFSCIVLVRKSINKSGPGFGYGFIMAWSFVMSFFTFLCGLILDSFHDVVEAELEKESKWKSYWTSAYIGSVACAFVCCALYMIFFLALVIFQGGISKAVGLYDVNTDEKRKLEMSGVNRMGGPNAMASTQI